MRISGICAIRGSSLIPPANPTPSPRSLRHVIIRLYNGGDLGTSEYSKGRGSRRFPGRGGGIGKQKNAESWRSRTTHAVESPALLSEKAEQVNYQGRSKKDVSELAYLLDQAFARAGIPYAVEPVSAFWCPALTVFVPASLREKAAAIISQLESQDYKPAAPRRLHEEPPAEHHRSMKSVHAEDVPAHLKDHPWEFAVYSERDGPLWRDKLIYRALVFRNRNHTLYGVKEWLDPGAPRDLSKMARRIVIDEKFRQSLITDDPRIPGIWAKLGLLPEY